MTYRFVSAGWPYLYDIPGLHNCIPMLFADACARYYRFKGDTVFYLCGADEHGARTEYVAQGYGTTPQELLDSKYEATLPLLKKLELSLDAFERTGDPFHQKFVQNLFSNFIDRKILTEGTQKVAWCTECQHHLPDRFLEGTCPYCGDKTYGNQCNNKKTCARLIEADEIKDGHCAVCSSSVEWRMETHLFFDMSPFKEVLVKATTSPERDSSEVARRILQSIDENPKVCVTRDTAWGIPLPASSCSSAISSRGLTVGSTVATAKSVYSWVDSLLAKVSMIAKRGTEMENNFWKNADAKHHFFLGMDGTPFYGALFPAMLLASNQNYNLAHWNIAPNDVFIYEGGICSKSTGTGIWLQEALATLPAEFWRFYIFFIHASVESGEQRDVDFRWDRFCGSINTWLIKGLTAVANTKNQKQNQDPILKEKISKDDGTKEAEQIAQFMEVGKIGQAFQLVLNSIVENPSWEKTQRLAPLLGCFLPTAAEKLLEGFAPFDMAPLYHREVQMEYQDKVDSRRGQRGLAEEITDARADVLCVCPINLMEH